MYSREIALEIAQNFTIDCIKRGVLVRKALLFGSYAKNEQQPQSDIDVALFADDVTNNILKTNRLIAVPAYTYNDIEPHLYAMTLYKESSIPLIEEIKRTGIEISF